ncbi:MAG: hypothetical protein Q8P18_26130 [Pseudomonadota bacterium]|nr:hypothetical protein [Pseudomonadota bacterium]
MLLLVGLALAAPTERSGCDPAAALSEVVSRGAREAYLCVSRAEVGKELVLAEMAKDPLGERSGRSDGRLTRALALWLLERTDRAMDPDLLARLAPADRRLLADGIRARRGRASPSPEHAAVFGQLSWYAPTPGYTDARLRPIDRANLALVDPAVRLLPPPDEEEGDEEAPAASGVSVATPATCGCASGGGRTGLGVGLAALVALLGVARRRGDQARDQARARTR